MTYHLPPMVQPPAHPSLLPSQQLHRSERPGLQPLSPIVRAPLLDSARGLAPPVEAAGRRFAADDSHPFDEPYSVLKSLRTEISELRCALQVEQKQRDIDVQRLAAELLELRGALSQDKGDLAAASLSWNRSLREEVARINGATQALDCKLTNALDNYHHSALTETNAVRQDLTKLAGHLELKHRDWLSSHEALVAKVKANEEGDTEFSRQVMQTLDEHAERAKALEEELGQSRAHADNLENQSTALGEAIKSVEEKHVREHTTLHAMLKSEVGRMERGIEEFRISTAAAMQRHWKTTTEDLTEVRARISGLNIGLERERNDRQNVGEVLDRRINENWGQTMKFTQVSDRAPSLYTHRNPSQRP